jgi:hypothetical protein
MSDEKNMSDLWSGLAGQAESWEPSRPISIPRQPVNRRSTLGEKLATAYLNGFLPALLALWGGVVMAGALSAQLLGGSVFQGMKVPLVALGMMLSLPLAWLTAGWWEGRPSVLKYLGLGFLAAGVGQLSMVLPYSGYASLQPRGLSPARLLQKLYESYLLWNSTLLAILVALLLFHGASKLRQGLPWLEFGRSFSGGRMALGALILLSPLLGLLGCALAVGRIAPQAAPAYEMIFKPNSARPDDTSSRDAWKALYTRLERIDSDYFRNFRGQAGWDTATHQAVESEALRLLQVERGSGSWNQRAVLEALLRQPDRLARPLELAQASLRFALASPDEVWGTTILCALRITYLPTLAGSSFSPTELEQQQQWLDQLQSSLPDPKQELEDQLASALRWQLQYQLEGGPQPLRAFGHELPFGPERLQAELRVRKVIYPWLAVKDRLDWSSQQALDRSLDRDLPPTMTLQTNQDALRGAIESARYRCYSLMLRPHLQAARTMLALHGYKLEHGHYPTSLEQLGEHGGVDPKIVSYQVVAGQARLGRDLEGRRLKQEDNSWTLP